MGGPRDHFAVPCGCPSCGPRVVGTGPRPRATRMVAALLCRPLRCLQRRTRFFHPVFTPVRPLTTRVHPMAEMPRSTCGSFVSPALRSLPAPVSGWPGLRPGALRPIQPSRPGGSFSSIRQGWSSASVRESLVDEVRSRRFRRRSDRRLGPWIPLRVEADWRVGAIVRDSFSWCSETIVLLSGSNVLAFRRARKASHDDTVCG